MKKNAFTRFVVYVVTVCMLGAGMPLPAAAGIVGTDQVAGPAEAATARDKLHSFLARDAVRAQLQSQGIDPQAAQDRVAALSDEEVTRLAGRIDQLPAGGDSVLGVLLAIFVILLITDILGFTKVFPFTRSVR